MGETTGIEWTDHTWNPWIGCTKVSPACDNCYAEREQDRRLHVAKWGKHEARHRTSEHNWNNPYRWDNRARRDGVFRKVFCASLADIFDAEVPDIWRWQAFERIIGTTNLYWQLLSKRHAVAKKWFDDWEYKASYYLNDPPYHLERVWLGMTVENQQMADARIPALLACKHVGKRWLSMEPLLGPVDITPFLGGERALDWIVVGGESGPGFRPLNLDHVYSLQDQCQRFNVPFFFKQMSGLHKKTMPPIPNNLIAKEFPV